MSQIKTHEIKLIVTTALPLMVAFLAQKGMQFIDTLMMGWIGPEALAAGALSTTVFTTMLVFCIGTLSSVGVYIARSRGAHQYDEIKLSVQRGMILAALLSLPCMFFIWKVPEALLWIGEDQAVVNNTKQLLHGLVWGFPGFLLFLVFREFVSAFALSRLVMIVTLSSMPFTFAANYIFIYGKWGFPALGVAGIGYAGAGIMWCMFLSLFFYCKKHPILKSHVSSLHRVTFEWRPLRAMFYLGLPSGLMYVLDMGMFSFAAIMMGHFGVHALAAHQIALQCATVAYAVPFALSMATGLQVSHAAGANNLQQAARFTYIGLGIGLIVSASIATLFIFIPEILINIFLQPNEENYQEISEMAISFLTISAFFQVFDAFQAILYGALRGLKDTLIPMLLCITCYWVMGIGSSYYFAFHTSLAANGIWYGLIIGIGSAAITLTLRFFRKQVRQQRFYNTEEIVISA